MRPHPLLVTVPVVLPRLLLPLLTLRPALPALLVIHALSPELVAPIARAPAAPATIATPVLREATLPTEFRRLHRSIINEVERFFLRRRRMNVQITLYQIAACVARRQRTSSFAKKLKTA